MDGFEKKLHSTIKLDIKYIFIEEYSDTRYGHFPLDKIKEVITIDAHNTFVQCMLLLKDGRLATGSRDETIKIWNLNNDNHLDLTLKGHTNSVSQIIQLDNSQVVSVDFGSLLVWDIQMDSYTLISKCKIDFHEIVSSLAELPNERLVTVSEHHILLWEKDSSSYSIKESINEGYESVLKLKNNNLCSHRTIVINPLGCCNR